MSASRRTNNLMIAGLIVVVTATLFILNADEKSVFTESIEAFEFDDQAILERAYEDVRNSEEYPQLEEEQIIKIFDEDHQLIQSMTLLAGDEIIDEDFRKLINKSTLLAEYRTSKIYKLNK